MIARLPGLRRNSVARPARARGFTLAELIVTISIVAILAAIAFPSYTQLMLRHRVQDAATDILIALNNARAEALKRNTSVGIAPASGGSWANGWAILDPNDNANFVDKHAPVNQVAITLTGTSPIYYRSTGRLSANPGPAFSLAATQGNYTAAACVTVDPSGRPYYTLGAPC